VKKILIALMLTSLGLRAQNQAFTPLPGSGQDTNQERLLEAMRKAAEGDTNAVVNQVPPPPTPPPQTTPAQTPAQPPPTTVPSARGFLGGRSPLKPLTAGPGTNAPGATLPTQAVPGGAVVPPNQTFPGQNPGEKLIAIPPSPGATNAPMDEKLEPPGFIRFPATDLNQVLKIYAELVNRTVLRPTTLPSQPITLETQTPLTRREAISAFDAVLGLNGIAVINIGDKFVKVVPNAQAGQVGAAFDTNDVNRIAEMGQFDTHIVQVTNAKPSELVQVLTPFASPGMQGIIPIDSSQILVLRDYAENVKRMLEMIKKVDVTVPEEFISEVIPIKYAKATEIAQALNSLSTGGAGGATVGGGTSAGGGALRTGVGGSRMGGMGGMGAYGRGGLGTYGGAYGGTTPGMNPAFGAQATATTPTTGAGGTFTQRIQNLLNRAGTMGEFQVIGQNKIIADERTNSLLIFAGRDDMKKIKDIITKLDVVLAQVLIEAVIVQVTLADDQNLSVSWLQKGQSSAGQVRGIGAINNGNFLNRNVFNNLTNGGPLQSGFSYLASFGGDLDMTLLAVADKSRAKVLQRPRIQTSHNETAHLFVGESRPYPTSSYYGGGAFGGYSSIQQLPIGVSLDVTPLINPDGLVVMEISQDIESVNGTVNIANVGDVPITSQKTATTKVSVRDHDTIILGGLIENSKSRSISGVPVLMNVPLIGYLFRSTADKSDRNELIVLIRPTVLPTPDVAALAARSEQNKMPMVKRYIEDTDAQQNKWIEEEDKESKKKHN
jgi:general secretion pathway protein D